MRDNLKEYPSFHILLMTIAVLLVAYRGISLGILKRMTQNNELQTRNMTFLKNNKLLAKITRVAM